MITVVLNKAVFKTVVFITVNFITVIFITVVCTEGLHERREWGRYCKNNVTQNNGFHNRVSKQWFS